MCDRLLGIEAQELTTAIGLLAEQLEADDDNTRAQALARQAAAEVASRAEAAARQAAAAQAAVQAQAEASLQTVSAQ